MRPKIIAFCGEIGSGKSHLANILAQYSNLDIAVIPMAAKLKEMASSLGWDGEKDQRGRRFLQELGAKMRDIDENYWINLWWPSCVAAGYLGYRYVIIDDARYVNELELADTVMRIETSKFGRDAKKGILDHSSEREWRTYIPDMVIRNDGDPDTVKMLLGLL